MADRRAIAAVAAVAAVLLAAAVAGCASGATPRSVATSRAAVGAPAAGSSASAVEAKDAATLLRVAAVFNDEYGNNDPAPVYARWDARSRAIIPGAEYVRRHNRCRTAPQAPAHVHTAAPGPGGAWLVRYSIGGQEFTDYWFFQHGRWVFDLILSNPQAAGLYRLSGAAYARAVGCTH